MEIGIDSFASAMYGSDVLSSTDAMEQLLDRSLWPTNPDWIFSGSENITKKNFWILHPPSSWLLPLPEQKQSV